MTTDNYTLIATTLLCITYGVLMVFAGNAILDGRPRPSFWRMLAAYVVGPLVLLIWGLGRVLLYSGASVSFSMDATLNKIVPLRRAGAYEDRLDLH